MRNLCGLATTIISMACSSANSTNSSDAMSPNASGGAIGAESTPSGAFQGLGGTNGSVSTATLGTDGTLTNATGGSSTMRATGGTQATGGVPTIGTSTANNGRLKLDWWIPGNRRKCHVLGRCKTGLRRSHRQPLKLPSLPSLLWLPRGRYGRNFWYWRKPIRGKRVCSWW
jgi:hypothetical protein